MEAHLHIRPFYEENIFFFAQWSEMEKMWPILFLHSGAKLQENGQNVLFTTFKQNLSVYTD